jgi:hypothetical protein
MWLKVPGIEKRGEILQNVSDKTYKMHIVLWLNSMYVRCVRVHVWRRTFLFIPIVFVILL